MISRTGGLSINNLHFSRVYINPALMHLSNSLYIHFYYDILNEISYTVYAFFKIVSLEEEILYLNGTFLAK